MRATNFKWYAARFIVVDYVEYDLHNSFDFYCVSYNVQTRTAELQWERGSSQWISPNLPKNITLNLRGVSEFTWAPRDPKIPFTEDDCLGSFGYNCDEDWADGQFWTDEEPDQKWRWSFEFQSGAELQLAGDTADVVIKP